MIATADQVEQFRAWIAQHLGLGFEDAKLGFLAELLHARARHHHQDPAGYLTRLARSPGDEIGALAESLTVGETYFFRYAAQFAAFTDVVLPDRMRARGARRQLRLLSAGCASGEEAYSLAIAARSIAPAPTWAVSIRGVDINPAALRRAASARFSNWAFRETPADLQEQWFSRDGRDHILDEQIRSAVTFERKNLIVDDPDLWQPAAYDVIFCRNVLMYFPPDVAERVVARVESALAPGGYLFLGHAETLRGLSQQFHLCHTHGTFYYQRRDGAPTPKAWPLDVRRAVPDVAAAVETGDGWVDAIQRAAERIRVLVEPPAQATHSAAVVPGPRPDLARILELVKHERYDDALGLLEGLSPASGHDVDVLLLRSVALTHAGRCAEAEVACRRLLEIDELHAGAHYVMALCREVVGDRKGAADHDQTAVYLDPMFAMPRLHLGLLARRAGDRELARRELAQALVLFQREDASRLLLFGGGFHRDALIALCRGELDGVGTGT
ncbi:MAG: Protein-glutamate O-methyltransferase [Myxococcales bacterium]|nr:Protein-glutamate O-methyltransferase [Myxococcales bacterium]